MLVQGDGVVQKCPKLHIIVVVMLQHFINFCLHTLCLLTVIFQVVLHDLKGLSQVLFFPLSVRIAHFHSISAAALSGRLLLISVFFSN